MPDFRTHYDNLKVSKQATSEELRAAFKSRFLKFHPGNHPGNRERTLRYLQIIKESYSILSDPEQRKAHDSWIAEKKSTSKKDGGEESEGIKHRNRLLSWKIPVSVLLLGILAYFGSTFMNLDDYSVVSLLESNEETNAENQFNFENQCRYPVTLAIRYWGVNEEWHKAGWWDVDPGDRVYLKDTEGNRLISNNAIWYYYARTNKGPDIEWTGKYPFRFDGSVLRMIELKDTVGDSDWFVSCDSDASPGVFNSIPN